MDKTEKLIQSLSPNERKIIPFLNEEVNEICEKAELDKVSVMRSLEYLQNKGIIKISSEKYDKDYFKNGIASGKSCYSNYRWLPELTIPMAYNIIKYCEGDVEVLPQIIERIY